MIGARFQRPLFRLALPRAVDREPRVSAYVRPAEEVDTLHHRAATQSQAHPMPEAHR